MSCEYRQTSDETGNMRAVIALALLVMFLLAAPAMAILYGFGVQFETPTGVRAYLMVLACIVALIAFLTLLLRAPARTDRRSETDPR